MVNVDNTKQKLADAYASLGTFFGLATDDPGTTATPAHEASGGGYARVATTWSAGAGGVERGTNCTISADAGTYPYAILCSAQTGHNMIDNCLAAGTTTLSSPGQIVLTPSYVQS
jgi:hypothetical protein